MPYFTCQKVIEASTYWLKGYFCPEISWLYSWGLNLTDYNLPSTFYLLKYLYRANTTIIMQYLSYQKVIEASTYWLKVGMHDDIGTTSVSADKSLKWPSSASADMNITADEPCR
jgi:hypothetical protein